ncbi:hypothetical protein Z042_20345 [Chania multitudinisentens RB-25]|uniref:Ricin B lectin domain-containing protein n=1 Tax=Chania multitudinisentens RB-25 TaxID=1441930 RepID=W0LGT3_9GAMM|nr:hypothetical protein [Chania multitudinisentens]AHG22936.1 hypothetical protein Z042_20345 [Chania multitudinisentens RB-25]
MQRNKNSKFKATMFFSIISLSFIHYNAISASTSKDIYDDYTSMRYWKPAKQSDGSYLIENKFRDPAGEALCLSADPLDRPSAVINHCSSTQSNLRDMKRWSMIEKEDGFYVLQNKHRKPDGEPLCLNILSPNDIAGVNYCNISSPEGYDYPSMIQWKFIKQPDGFYLMENKYKRPGKKSRCLAADSMNKTAIAIECPVEEKKSSINHQ